MRLTASLPRRHATLVKCLLGPPLALVFGYAVWQWANYLNEEIFSVDRFFHTMALLDPHTKTSEPLWGFIGPQFGKYFPEEPFEVASIVTMALLIVGMALNRFALLPFLIVAFSPGLSYMLTNALRQGMALGLFMVAFGLLRRWRNDGLVFKPWMVIACAIPAALVHNVIAVATVYLVACFVIGRRAAHGRTSQNQQILIAGAAVLLYLVSSRLGMAEDGGSEGGGGTARAMITMLVASVAASIATKRWRGAEIPLYGVTILAMASGFMFTTTGLRVVIMIGLLAPLALGRRGNYVALAACVAYPIFMVATMSDADGWLLQ